MLEERDSLQDLQSETYNLKFPDLKGFPGHVE
jgi:hypothetical protein